MIKNFRQFNESFVDIFNKYKEGMLEEFKIRSKPIADFAQDIKDIILKFEDESGDDYQLKKGNFVSRYGWGVGFILDPKNNEVKLDVSNYNNFYFNPRRVDGYFSDEFTIDFEIDTQFPNTTSEKLIEQVQKMYPFIVAKVETDRVSDQKFKIVLSFKISDIK